MCRQLDENLSSSPVTQTLAFRWARARHTSAVIAISSLTASIGPVFSAPRLEVWIDPTPPVVESMTASTRSLVEAKAYRMSSPRQGGSGGGAGPGSRGAAGARGRVAQSEPGRTPFSVPRGSHAVHTRRRAFHCGRHTPWAVLVSCCRECTTPMTDSARHSQLLRLAGSAAQPVALAAKDNTRGPRTGTRGRGTQLVWPR